MDAIFERTSVRDFLMTKIPRDKIEKILEAGMCAPSAGNQRPWEFYVALNPVTRSSLAKASPYAGAAEKAPVVIVPCIRKKDLSFPECAPLDMSACCENMLLEIKSQGLGGVWLSLAPYPERVKAAGAVLDLPGDEEAFALIALGYPVRESMPKKRFDFSRVITI